jgi:regulator of cell morphogenesis and NO signaling
MLQGSSKIESLVSSNYIYASVLYYFGIDFYNVSNDTLEEVCKKNSLKTHQVITRLEEAAQQTNKSELRELINYPINLIIQYLRHAHSVFIKKDLPYIAHLIAHLSPQRDEYCTIVKDLKIVFPLFAEDFIHHIYKEEDSLFSHVEQLLKAHRQGFLTSNQYYMLEKSTLQQFAVEHAEHDDEMNSVRKIAKHYRLKSGTPLHLKVIFSELQNLEEKLRIHALVENHILFPKALQLEDQVIKMNKEVIKYN